MSFFSHTTIFLSILLLKMQKFIEPNVEAYIKRFSSRPIRLTPAGTVPLIKVVSATKIDNQYYVHYVLKPLSA